MTKTTQQRPAAKPETIKELKEWLDLIDIRLEGLDQLQEGAAKRLSAVETKIEQMAKTCELALDAGNEARVNVVKHLNHIANIESRMDKCANQVKELANVKPIKGQPKGEMLEVDTQTVRAMAVQAQFLGMRSPDELAQIVLHAFLEMCEEDNWLTFPLALQQEWRQYDCSRNDY